MVVDISVRGGTLIGATMLNYPVAKDRPDTLVQLLSTDSRDLGLIQTGLNTGVEGPMPSHTALFRSRRTHYELDGADEIVVPLSWTDGSGVEVEKRYWFRRGSYAVQLEQQIDNGSDAPWKGGAYAQIVRRLRATDRSMFNVDSYSYDGPVVYDGDKSDKLDADDLDNGRGYYFESERGWLASIEHHFLSAIVPQRDGAYDFAVTLSSNGDSTRSSTISKKQTVLPGASKTFTTTLFVGPKLQSQLEEIDPKLKLTVDYGWLTILSGPMFWLLNKLFGIVGNWGVAIMGVTILIKLAFYKLTEASGRSMARMRNLQPRMKALQDRYKDDRQQLSQAMMELYKREHVNPAAGCLPILIQMPFFLSFYWVLVESVEMRQAPFMLWITDLSSKDPFFILPLIMGAAMFLQQKLNPTPADPVQAKVMQIMPIMFTGFFAFFPSGLVLYWATNTVLSIAQQWKINKVVEAEAKAKKGGKKKPKKEKSNN
jgi:YidC/Oxa1 family membrane protein insertase